MIQKDFEIIERLFIDIFNEQSDKINNAFPDLGCSVYVYPPSDGTGYYCIGLDVVLLNVFEDNADNLCLEVYIDEQNTKCLMNSRIVWGYPSGKLVKRLFENSIEITEINIEILKEKLSLMFEKFNEEIKNNPNGK
jgi:hypothetical protein